MVCLNMISKQRGGTVPIERAELEKKCYFLTRIRVPNVDLFWLKHFADSALSFVQIGREMQRIGRNFHIHSEIK